MKIMKVLVMMVVMMIIPMKPSSMTMMMAMTSPLWEGTPQRRWSLSAIPPGLRFSKRRYTRGGASRGGPGQPHHQWHSLGLARGTRWCGPLVAHLALSFWLLSSSSNIWISGYFPRIVGLQKYGVLTVLFPVESWLRQWALQYSSNMWKQRKQHKYRL
jgi:hypothetical protein